EQLLAELSQLLGNVRWHRVLHEVGDQLGQLDAERIDVPHPLEVDGRDRRAATLTADDETIDPEHRQGFPDRGAADTELFGQSLFTEGGPGRQIQETDAVA